MDASSAALHERAADPDGVLHCWVDRQGNLRQVVHGRAE